jgi:hypothetical protein
LLKSMPATKISWLKKVCTCRFAIRITHVPLFQPQQWQHQKSKQPRHLQLHLHQVRIFLFHASFVQISISELE